MMRDRHVIRISLRLISILLVTVAVGIIALRPITMIISWDRYVGVDWLLLLKQLARGIRHDVLPGVTALVIIAAALWLLQRPLARLIVPRAGATCPECGYSLRGIQAARCPECGAEIRKPAAGG